jgi:quinoprotein glucose dehydrogenase
MHTHDEGERIGSRGGPGLGVGYWTDGTNERVIYVTRGYTMFSLDAKTGLPDPAFGTGGFVDLRKDNDQEIDPVKGVIGLHAPPLVVRNTVVVGAAPTAFAKGYVRGFDIKTGTRKWIFHTIPKKGEFGYDTWLTPGQAEQNGNTGAWAPMSADEQLGLLYVGVELPPTDMLGVGRQGPGLFGESLVALDIETGVRKWHYQIIHHGLWDRDVSCAGVICDIPHNGKIIKAIAQPTKQGYVYVLDRTNGKPVWPIPEKPAAKGDVPGEWYSPTQPFPVKPPALTRVDFNKERDMVRPEDTSADHVKACQELWDKSGGFFNAGPFTPFMFHEEGAAPKSTIQFPGGTGGVNWGGPAADPSTGYVFVNAHDTSLVGWIEKVRPGQNYGRGTEGSKQLYDRGSVNGAGPYFTFSAPMRDESGRVVANLPCQRPPWGRLVAVNANTGDIAWQVPLGTTDALPEGKRNTGNSGSAGPIATAGGVVIVGATTDRRIRAFDSKTGKELWAAPLPGQGNANPITYTGKNGKQYVAIVATDSLQVFSLP